LVERNKKINKSEKKIIRNEINPQNHTQAIIPEFGFHVVNGWRFVLQTVLLGEGKSIGSRGEKDKLKKKEKKNIKIK
jgi:hypothetical protein